MSTTAGRWLVAALLGVGGCAAEEAAPVVETVERPATPSQAPGDAWFSVRASCEATLEAFARYAEQPGVLAPKAVRLAEDGGWCSVSPERVLGTRADSWAQGTAGQLNAAAVAFFSEGGRWSYAVYDGGAPVVALESHYGERAVVLGDLDRAATVLGVAPGLLKRSLAEVGDPDKQAPFVTSLAIPARPILTTPTPLKRAVAETGEPTNATPDVLPTDLDRMPPDDPENPRYSAGSWVVMPPLGILLVSAIETRDVDGVPTPSYVVVDGPRKLPVPIARSAEVGMRRVATEAQADAILALLEDDVEVEDAERYVEPRVRAWLTSLKRGDLDTITTAYRQMCAVRAVRDLYQLEDGLLDSARSWLIEELAMAKRDTTSREDIETSVREGCQ